MSTSLFVIIGPPVLNFAVIAELSIPNPSLIWNYALFGPNVSKKNINIRLDMAKRVEWVGFGSGQSGRWSKHVIFKWVNWVAGQTGRGLSRVASRVELTRIFQINFFFFEVDAICQFFMSFLTMIRFSLVILLPITTKHLT